MCACAHGASFPQSRGTCISSRVVWALVGDHGFVALTVVRVVLPRTWVPSSKPGDRKPSSSMLAALYSDICCTRCNDMSGYPRKFSRPSNAQKMWEALVSGGP